MKRNILILISTSLILSLSQSCSTVKDLCQRITALPEIIGPDKQNDVGYPGVNVFEEDVKTDDSRKITGFFGIVRHTIHGSDRWSDPVGIQAGVIYPFYRINDFLDLRAEANFTMQGARWEEEDTKGRTNLIYINTPFVTRYQTNFGLYAEAGIQPGFLLSARKYEGTIDNEMVNMRKVDLSIPFGIGYDFKNTFGLGIRVITGLTDISRYISSYDRNFVIALRGTYTF